MASNSTGFRANPMRRRGSNGSGELPRLDGEHSASSGNGRSVRRKSRRPRMKGRTRMDASRQMVIITLGGALVLFGCLLILFSFNSESHNHNSRLGKAILNNDNSRRKILPPRAFTRNTVDAPECDAMSPMDVTYTLVTQLSSDRIWMMEHHCDRWGSTSPISVAVFTDQAVTEVNHQLVELGCNPETLTVQTLSTELYHSDDYPVNVLRNMALSVVTTSHVMFSDVDFWESEDLHDILQDDDVREVLAGDAKRALVVPAFQLNRQCGEWRDCRERNLPKMPRNKKDMIKLIQEKKGYPFDPTNHGGHGSTLYSAWFRQHASDVIDIPCIRSNRYEPYMVFRYCRDLPPFHEEFSGYGKNKMTVRLFVSLFVIVACAFLPANTHTNAFTVVGDAHETHRISIFAAWWRIRRPLSAFRLSVKNGVE